VLPLGKAVAVYFQAAANHPFTFLGALGPARPSVSFPLLEVGDEPEPPVGPMKLGVVVEDAIVLPPPPDAQGGREGIKERNSTVFTVLCHNPNIQLLHRISVSKNKKKESYTC
jgi:hypothetical protein